MGGGGGGPSIVQFEKNRLKSQFFAIQDHIIFLQKLPITHLLSIKHQNEKNPWVCILE